MALPINGHVAFFSTSEAFSSPLSSTGLLGLSLIYRFLQKLPVIYQMSPVIWFLLRSRRRVSPAAAKRCGYLTASLLEGYVHPPLGAQLHLVLRPPGAH